MLIRIDLMYFRFLESSCASVLIFNAVFWSVWAWWVISTTDSGTVESIHKKKQGTKLVCAGRRFGSKWQCYKSLIRYAGKAGIIWASVVHSEHWTLISNHRIIKPKGLGNESENRPMPRLRVPSIPFSERVPGVRCTSTSLYQIVIQVLLCRYKFLCLAKDVTGDSPALLSG